MHTRMAPYEIYLWLAIIVLQFGVGMAGRSFMRTFLLSQTVLGATLLTIARATPWQVYLKAYCISTFLHEGLILFLTLAIIGSVRRCGLPDRQSIIPVQVAAGIAFALGIRSASSALVHLQSPSWRLLFSWDQAFQFAICLMIGFLPVYAIYLSASLSCSTILKIIGFGAYSAANAGALDKFVFCKTFSHIGDFVYLGTLLIWFIAARTDRTMYPVATALELEDFECEG